MKYLSGRSQRKRNYIKYALLLSVFLLIIIFWVSIRKHAYPLLEPAVIRYGGTKQSFTVFPEFFSTYLTSHKALAERNKKLELDIERLENELADKDADMRELGLVSDVESATTTLLDAKTIALYPLMQDITKVYSTILLSKGYKDGVAVGAIVYLRGNQAVCMIQEVFTSTALCQLLTSSGVVTEGVTSSSSITLSLIGRGGHFLANIPRDTPVSVGEKVYLRSNQRFVVGTVQEVSNNNQDTSWHVFVRGAYNPVTSSTFYVQPQ